MLQEVVIMLLVKEAVKEEMVKLERNETMQLFAVIENPQAKRFLSLKGNHIVEKIHVTFTGNEFRIKSFVTGNKTVQEFSEYCNNTQLFSCESEAVDAAKRLTEQIQKEVKATLLADF